MSRHDSYFFAGRGEPEISWSLHSEPPPRFLIGRKERWECDGAASDEERAMMNEETSTTFVYRDGAWSEVEGPLIPQGTQDR